MQQFVAMAADKVEFVRGRLPSQFPERVIDAIERGVRQQAETFLAAAGAKA